MTQRQQLRFPLVLLALSMTIPKSFMNVCSRCPERGNVHFAAVLISFKNITYRRPCPNVVRQPVFFNRDVEMLGFSTDSITNLNVGLSQPHVGAGKSAFFFAVGFLKCLFAVGGFLSNRIGR